MQTYIHTDIQKWIRTGIHNAYRQTDIEAYSTTDKPIDIGINNFRYT